MLQQEKSGRAGGRSGNNPQPASFRPEATASAVGMGRFSVLEGTLEPGITRRFYGPDTEVPASPFLLLLCSGGW